MMRCRATISRADRVFADGRWTDTMDTVAANVACKVTQPTGRQIMEAAQYKAELLTAVLCEGGTSVQVNDEITITEAPNPALVGHVYEARSVEHPDSVAAYVRADCVRKVREGEAA